MTGFVWQISGIQYIFMNVLIMLIKLSAQGNEMWSHSMKYINYANKVISPGHFLLDLGRQSNDISKTGLAWNPQTTWKN